MVMNCPFDCSFIPDELKAQVHEMINAYHRKGEEG